MHARLIGFCSFLLEARIAPPAVRAPHLCGRTKESLQPSPTLSRVIAYLRTHNSGAGPGRTESHSLSVSHCTLRLGLLSGLGRGALLRALSLAWATVHMFYLAIVLSAANGGGAVEARLVMRSRAGAPPQSVCGTLGSSAREPSGFVRRSGSSRHGLTRREPASHPSAAPCKSRT